MGFNPGDCKTGVLARSSLGMRGRGRPRLEFGHFAIAQRAKTEQPMGFSPGKDVPERIALKGRPSAGHHSQR